MLSEKLKKERELRNASRRTMYRLPFTEIPRPYVYGDRKIISPVDQTLNSQEYINFAGHISNDITIILRVNDETAMRAALSKVRLLQQSNDNFGEMSNEEIIMYIKPRNVQTLAEIEKWHTAIAEHDFDKLSSMIDYREPLDEKPLDEKPLDESKTD